MKKKYKINWFVVVILCIVFNLVIFAIKDNYRTTKQDKVVQIHKEEKKPVKEEVEYESEDVEEEQVIEEPTYQDTYTTRMTSYYPEEGETMTASGLGINNFGVNDKGWFTYQDKLVMATASTRLGATSMRTYNLYDEFIVNIDGVDYNAIVLDVCGACQWDNRIDLFASSVVYARDTMVEVKVK